MPDCVRLQFSTERNLPSAVIRWYAHSLYSHVDFVLPDGRLLGARFNYPVEGQTGVQIRPADYAHFSRRLVVEIPTAKAPAIYRWARSQLGAPYDWSAILGFAADRDWRYPGRWICSELAVRAFEVNRFWSRPLLVAASGIDPGAALLLLSPSISAHQAF